MLEAAPIPLHKVGRCDKDGECDVGQSWTVRSPSGA